MNCCKSTSQQRTQRCSCCSRGKTDNQTKHSTCSTQHWCPSSALAPLLPAEPSPSAHQVCCPPLPPVLRVAPHSRLFGCSQAQAAPQTRPPGLATAPPHGSARHTSDSTQTSADQGLRETHCFHGGPAALMQAAHTTSQLLRLRKRLRLQFKSPNKDPLSSSAHLQGHHFARLAVGHTTSVEPL